MNDKPTGDKVKPDSSSVQLSQDEIDSTIRRAQQTYLSDDDKPSAYEPRTLWQKLLPAVALIVVILLAFVFFYYVAESQDNLLSAQFLLMMPFFFGAWAVYFASYRQPKTTSQIFVLFFWVMLGILLISMPILKEGVICMVIASPVLYVMMLFGGLLMNAFLKRVWHSKALHSTILLPLLVLFMPMDEMPATYQVTDSVVIHATPNEVWQSINHIEDITAEQFYQDSKLLPFMQVPAPKSAVTVLEGGQLVRKCQWHGDIYFDEPVISQVPNEQLRWQFVFYPDSVPPRTLDDHVTINGDHFKLLHGQYDLEAIDGGSTRLTFNVTYRITTSLNRYAGFWGKWVMNEFVHDTLGLYKSRLEG